MSFTRETLAKLNVKNLKDFARECGIMLEPTWKKDTILEAILAMPERHDLFSEEDEEPEVVAERPPPTRRSSRMRGESAVPQPAAPAGPSRTNAKNKGKARAPAPYRVLRNNRSAGANLVSPQLVSPRSTPGSPTPPPLSFSGPSFHPVPQPAAVEETVPHALVGPVRTSAHNKGKGRASDPYIRRPRDKSFGHSPDVPYLPPHISASAAPSAPPTRPRLANRRLPPALPHRSPTPPAGYTLPDAPYLPPNISAFPPPSAPPTRPRLPNRRLPPALPHRSPPPAAGYTLPGHSPYTSPSPSPYHPDPDAPISDVAATVAMIEQVSVENAKLAAAVTDMHSSGEELREEVAALQARLRAETARRERMVLMWSWWKWEPMPLSFEVLFGKGMDAFTMDEGTELSLEEIETAVRKYLNKIGLTVGIPEASHHKLTERTVRRLMKRIIKGRLDAKGFAAPTVFPRLLSEKQLEALAEAAKVAEAEAAKVAAAAADPTVAAPPAIPAPVNGGRPQPPPRRAPQASSSQVTQDPRRRPRSNMAPPLFTKSPPHLPESDDVDELVDDILTTYTTQGYLGLSDGPPPGEASSSSQVALKPTDHPSIKASGKRRRADDDDGNAGEEGRPSKQARPTFLDRLGLAHGPQPQLFGATRPANPAMWAHEHRDHRMTTSPDSPPPDSGPSHRPGTAILPEEDYMSEPEYVDEGIVKEEEEEDECEIVPPYYPGSE